jgi:hypothetical protein
MRWTAVTAQRNAELILARLKSIPDVHLSAGWRHFQDTNDNAVRLGVSIPLPVFDQNTGNIIAAQETLAKAGAERAINKLVLISIAGRAYDALTGALAELKLLRTSVIPNARSAAETIQGATFKAASHCSNCSMFEARFCRHCSGSRRLCRISTLPSRQSKVSSVIRFRSPARVQDDFWIDPLLGPHVGCHHACLWRLPNVDAGDHENDLD